MSGKAWLRALADWTLPPGALRRLRATGAAARHRFGTPPAARRELARNAALRGRHRGERVFILATGPSLATQDLTPLAGKACIGVSNFFVHPLFAQLAPRYYCVAPWHPPLTEAAWSAWLGEMLPALAGLPQCTPFFALDDRARVAPALSAGGGAALTAHYMAFDPFVPVGRADLTGLALAPQSVTVMAIQLALHLGFGEIVLLGCDHDWLLHLNESRHFYAEDRHAARREGYDEWFGADFASYCADYVRLWDQYRALGRAAEAASARILNATAGGVLDIFPRVTLAEAARAR